MRAVNGEGSQASNSGHVGVIEEKQPVKVNRVEVQVIQSNLNGSPQRSRGYNHPWARNNSTQLQPEMRVIE